MSRQEKREKLTHQHSTRGKVIIFGDFVRSNMTFVGIKKRMTDFVYHTPFSSLH
jgi:hypothetical protein